MLMKDVEHANRKKFDDQRVKLGILFLADAVIHGGKFNSSNFIDGFGCPNEKLAEFHKEPQDTKSI